MKRLAPAIVVAIISSGLMGAASQPVLTMDGLAPVTFGMTVAAAERALGAKLSVEFPTANPNEACVLTANSVRFGW